MKRAKESGCSFRKKRKARKEELKKNEGDSIEVRKHLFGVRTPFHQTRCTRLALLTPVNQYRKLKKKQPLATSEIMKKQIFRAIYYK